MMQKSGIQSLIMLSLTLKCANFFDAVDQGVKTVDIPEIGEISLVGCNIFGKFTLRDVYLAL